MTPDNLEELRKAAEKATPGVWFSDSDRGDQFDAYAVYAENVGYPGNTASICDTHNAGAVTIEQEDGRPWDETGRRNMAFIALANPQTILAMIGEIERLRGALQNCLALVRLKYGNLDPDVNAVMSDATAALTEPKEG